MTFLIDPYRFGGSSIPSGYVKIYTGASVTPSGWTADGDLHYDGNDVWAAPDVTSVETTHAGNLDGALDFSGLTGIQYVHFYSNQITSLDLTGCAALTELRAGSNLSLANVDLSDCASLQHLDLNSCSAINAVDVSACPDLAWADVATGALSSLDVTSNPSLGTLQFHGNSGITSIDLSANTALTYLRFDHTGLTSIDLTGLDALELIYAEYVSGLTAIDASGKAALEYLNVQQSASMASIDVSGCTSLNAVFASNCDLEEAALDTLLYDLDQNGVGGGQLYADGAGNGSPSYFTGLSYRDSLVANAWTVVINEPSSPCPGHNGDQGGCEAETGCQWDTADCSIFNGNQSGCEAETGCSWDGSGGDCGDFSGNQSTCESTSGCTWNPEDSSCAFADESECNGNPNCSATTEDCGIYGADQETCEAQSGCSWDGSACSGTHFTGCSPLPAYCSGTYENALCSGTYYPGTCSDA